jgi:hypothetical protein
VWYDTWEKEEAAAKNIHMAWTIVSAQYSTVQNSTVQYSTVEYVLTEVADGEGAGVVQADDQAPLRAEGGHRHLHRHAGHLGHPHCTVGWQDSRSAGLQDSTIVGDKRGCLVR